jgi:hypothetical protein
MPGVLTHVNAFRGMGLHSDAHTQTRKIAVEIEEEKKGMNQGTLS